MNLSFDKRSLRRPPCCVLTQVQVSCRLEFVLPSPNDVFLVFTWQSLPNNGIFLAFFSLIVDVIVALSPPWKLRLFGVFIDLKQVEKCLSRPPISMKPNLGDIHPGHNFVQDPLAKWRGMQCVSPDVSDHLCRNDTLCFTLRHECVHDDILERRDHVLVAKQPDPAEQVEGKLLTFVRDATAVDELAEDLENILALIVQSNLTFSCFLERTIEGSAEVVGVESEEILVNNIVFLCRSDFDYDTGACMAGAEIGQ